MDDARFQVLYDFLVRGEDKLERCAKTLESINSHVGQSAASLKKLEDIMAPVFKGLGDKADRSKRSMLDLASAVYVVRSAFDIARSTIGTAANALGQFGDTSIKAFGERTSTIRGYTTFLNGDRGQAELEFYRAQQFAQKTDFTSQTIEQGQSRLLAQGFRGHDLYATLFAASDLAAASPDDKNETLKRLVKGFTDVKAKGHLQGEELTTQFAEAGLNLVLVKEELRKSLGLKNIGAVDKAISSGSVSADVALPAIQRAILAQLHTTKAGEFATSSAGSLTSLISNRDEAFKNLLKSFDADEALPAIGRYKDALRDQSAQLDIATRSGKNMALVLQDISNQAIDGKAAWTEFSTGFLESFGRTYTSTLRTISPSNIDDSSRSIETFGQSIGKLGSVTAIAVHSFDGFATRLANFADLITGESYERRRREQAESDQKTEEDVRTAALKRLAAAGLTLGDYTTADIFKPGAANFLQTYGPPTPSDDQLKELQRAKERAANKLTAAVAGGKSKAEHGWNVPIWHYEPGTGGVSVNGASSVNALVAAQVGGGSVPGREGRINVEKIEIVVMGASQSPQDIAHAVHEELVSKLRSLPRAPSLRR